MKTFTRAALAAVFAATAATPAFAQLNRVGPVGPLGYPDWYQDKTGLTLEFCDSKTPAELAGGWCVLLPGDIPNGAPESRVGNPPNFADEHFYYVMNAGGSNIATAGGTRVLLVAAIEGAFASGPVAAGDEVVFARLRLRIDSLPVSGEYVIYTPFGKRTFPDQVAGDRLFATEDVGLTAGAFQDALNGSIFPFLAPSNTPGGPELPPVSAANPTPDSNPAHFGGGSPTPYPGNGRRYIADPARVGPITGSLQNYSNEGPGVTISTPNIFRVDVITADGTRTTIYETTDFSLAGRIFEGPISGDVKVTRANYARSADGTGKIDLYATATPITRGRVPGQTSTAPIPSSLSYFSAACTPTFDALRNPGAPYFAPAGATQPIALRNTGETYFAQFGAVPSGMEGCLQANATTTDGQAKTVYLPVHFTDQIFISDASYDASTQTLTAHASSSDAFVAQTLTAPEVNGAFQSGQLSVNALLAPPSSLVVKSSGGGSNSLQLTTGTPAPVTVPAGGTGGTGGGTGGTTPATAPIASNLSTATIEDLVSQPFALTDDSTLTAAIVSNGSLGTATLAADSRTVTFTPNPNASGTDTFSFVLTNAAGLSSNTASVTVTIVAQNDAPTAQTETVNAIAGTPVTINVLSNDVDPDGPANLDHVEILSSDSGLGTMTVNGAFVTFTAQSGTSSLQFTYRAVDKDGAASNWVTDTVNVFGNEIISPTRWQYTTSQNRWVVTGTVNPNIGQTLTISYATGTYNVWNGSGFQCSGTAAGTVVGTATPDGTNTFAFDQGGINPRSILNPTNSNNTVTSPDGRTTKSLWCSTPTLRIQSSAKANIVVGAVQVK